MEWITPVYPKTFLPTRRNHTAVISGDSLIVHGGITTDHDEIHYLDDMWVFNLKTRLWMSFYPKYGKLPKLAYHSMCVSNYDTNLQFNEKVVAPPKLKEVVISLDTEQSGGNSYLNMDLTNAEMALGKRKKRKKLIKLKKRASLLLS